MQPPESKNPRREPGASLKDRHVRPLLNSKPLPPSKQHSPASRRKLNGARSGDRPRLGVRHDQSQCLRPRQLRNGNREKRETRWSTASNAIGAGNVIL